MKKNNFLKRLRLERKLELIETSDEICESYLEKSNNCKKSAEILLKNNLYENSVSMSYYSMYNSLIALFFKVGIKCENHSGSILLFKLLFRDNELFDLISKAKKERINLQYYVVVERNEMTKEIAKQLINHSEKFNLGIKTILNNLHR